MVEVEETKSCDCQYQNRHLIEENYVGNYLEHDEQLRVVLDRLSLRVLQFHDRIVHQRFHFAEEKDEISDVVIKLHFLYSKEHHQQFTKDFLERTHQNQLSSVGF